MLYVGVDLGTSAVKLLLMEADGTIRNIVSKEYPLFLPHPGWSEQNPEDWLEKTLEGLQELTRGYDSQQIAGIGVGGQMHGLVTLDDQDRPIRPYCGMMEDRKRRPAISMKKWEKRNSQNIRQTLHLPALQPQKYFG